MIDTVAGNWHRIIQQLFVTRRYLSMSIPPNTISTVHPFLCSAAWDAETLRKDTSWIIHLTESHRVEIIEALRHFKATMQARGLTAQWLHGHMMPTKEHFPLPTLAPLLQQAQDDLERKYGMVLFKGFPVEGQSTKDLHMMHAGLASHVGILRTQTVFGELIQDLQDGGQGALKERRGSKHNRALPFHNDPSDAISFLCIHSALTGGIGLFSSSIAIHNALLKRVPDLVEVLYQDFAWSYQDYLYVRTGANQEFTPKERFYVMPVFTSEQGQFACKYSRFYIDQAQEYPDVPRLTEKQIAALNALEEEMQNEKWKLARQYETGDVMFINNFVCFHARTAFTDDDMDENRRRHLLRIWLSMPNSRPLASCWSRQLFYRRTEAGAIRGGVPTHEIMYNHA